MIYVRTTPTEIGSGIGNQNKTDETHKTKVKNQWFVDMIILKKENTELNKVIDIDDLPKKKFNKIKIGKCG